MRWQLFAAAAVVAASAAPVHAQTVNGDPSGPSRRFTGSATDTNRSNKIIYAPVAWGFGRSKPATQGYDLAAAVWETAPGARSATPLLTREKGDYTLERFERVPGDPQMMRVVISRRNAERPSTAPELRLTDGDTRISTYAAVQSMSGGRYTFVVRDPAYGFVRQSSKYSVEFLPAYEVKQPPSITRAPTFQGDSIEARMIQPPPRLPKIEEKVAGRRIEYRSGHVVQNR